MGGSGAPVALKDAIAGEVLALMGRHRVSQQKLGRIIGMSQPTLSKRLGGIVPWSIDELEAVAAHFDVSIGSLLGPPTIPGTNSRCSSAPLREGAGTRRKGRDASASAERYALTPAAA